MTLPAVPADGLRHSDSLVLDATPEQVYDLVSDVTRTGEWSPVCVACAWEDPDCAGEVGAAFTGRNESGGRTWETRSVVEVADRGREFAWAVNGGFVRWSWTMRPHGDGTLVTESWHFRPEGLAFFAEKYGDRAQAAIDARTRDAHEGIPASLRAVGELLATR